MPYGVVAPPTANSQDFTRNLLGDHINDFAADPLILIRKAIFFYGFVRYETILKQTFRLGFCFIFDRFSERWILSGDDGYNYLTEEK